jgi:intracellular sulfur oxidation DsrE/DsrF family protein
MLFTLRSIVVALVASAMLAGAAAAQTPIAAAPAAQPTPSATPAEPKKLGCTSEAAMSQKPKVVFQINRAEDAPLILRFVGNYLKSEPEAEVAVVGYSTCVDFMLKGATDAEGKPYAVQVNRLLDLGVSFKVCNNTLKARNATADVVLAHVGIVSSAVNEIVRLQTQEGYSYFQH